MSDNSAQPNRHTQGTWRVEKQNPEAEFTSIGGPVCKVGGEELAESVEYIVGTSGDWGSHGPEETEANAYLISAAPDLLDACGGLLDAIHDSMTHESQKFHSDQIAAARAAIAKAKGGEA